MSYLTELEAREKLCPSMTDGKQTAPREGAYEQVAQSHCMTSGCMAWRWAGGLPSTEKGYCGLAGRPGVFEKDDTA